MTIVVMGIIFAVASSIFLDTIESRRVDSAANQLAADLRLAHESAKNRLADYQIVVPTDNSSTYQIGPSGGTLATRTLPDRTKIAATATITFESDGSALLPGGTPSVALTVSSDDGAPSSDTEVIAATSRVKID